MIKKILLSFLVTFSFIVTSIQSFAEPGDLTINNEVIYRKNKANHHNVSGEFIVPDLFLEKKTNQDALLKEKTKKQLTDIETHIFLEKTPHEEALNTKVVPLLFTNDNDVRYLEENDTNSSQSNLRQLGVIVSLIIGSALFLVIGIFFGKKFSYVFK